MTSTGGDVIERAAIAFYAWSRGSTPEVVKPLWADTPKANQDYFRSAAQALASAGLLVSANTAGGEGLKLAREIYDLVSVKVSRAEYEADELQNPKAWDEIAGWSRDGTLASFRQLIEELETQ